MPIASSSQRVLRTCGLVRATARCGAWFIATSASLFAVSGCASLANVRAGFAGGTSGALGGALEGNVGFGLGDPSGGVGADVALRGKVHSRGGGFAVGTGAWAAAASSSFLAFGHLGLHLFQFDVLGGTPYAGIASPYLVLGVGIPVHSRSSGTYFRSSQHTAVTFGLTAEYDVRFSIAGEGFFGVFVGAARFSGGRF